MAERRRKEQKEFRLLKSYWDAEVSFSHSLMPNVSLDNLRKKIDDQSRQKRLRLIRFIATPIAAAIAFLVLFFATTHLNTREGKVQQFYTYITDKNKSHFTLDDGTKIILNRNSRFTYSDAYGTDQRKVNLEGEAYFEVAKNPERPFIVDMGNASIRVLGTTFSVKADKGRIRSQPSCWKGLSVSKARHNKSYSLPTSNLHSSVQRTRLISIRQRKENLAWKDGLLKYKSIALCTLLNELEKDTRSRSI